MEIEELKAFNCKDHYESHIAELTAELEKLKTHYEEAKKKVHSSNEDTQESDVIDKVRDSLNWIGVHLL